MVGHVDSYGDIAVAALAREEGVEAFVALRAPVPRSELMPLLARAAMLVSLPQDSDMAIPSKIYEYTRFPAWLLALADAESATARLLSGSGADVVAPHDLETMARVIRARCLEFWTSGRPRPVGADGRFSRREQARRFVNALERVLERAPGPAEPAGSARPALSGWGQ